jgi:hypothetical protein
MRHTLVFYYELSSCAAKRCFQTKAAGRAGLPLVFLTVPQSD